LGAFGRSVCRVSGASSTRGDDDSAAVVYSDRWVEELPALKSSDTGVRIRRGGGAAGFGSARSPPRGTGSPRTNASEARATCTQNRSAVGTREIGAGPSLDRGELRLYGPPLGTAG
jgi:hypothetical protein